VPGFEHSQRPEAKSGEAPGARVARTVIKGYGGAGEDELTRGASFVNCPADVIPQLGRYLPFI